MYFYLVIFSNSYSKGFVKIYRLVCVFYHIQLLLNSQCTPSYGENFSRFRALSTAGRICKELAGASASS